MGHKAVGVHPLRMYGLCEPFCVIIYLSLALCICVVSVVDIVHGRVE